MELQIQKQNPKFKNALVCDVELQNKTNTQVIVFFNALEINFEELNRGIKEGLQRCTNVKRFKKFMVNNKLEKTLEFNETENDCNIL